MNGNALIEIVKNSMPMLQSSLKAVVGAVLATLFLKKNTSTVEFEKIKSGKFKEVINSLLDNGKMTYREFYKCSNFLVIAEKADESTIETQHNDRDDQRNGNGYDFDWFIRFFDAASNISNEDMQNLWARVLAGEVRDQGSFSLRTLDTLYNMSQSEAKTFADVSNIVLDYSIIFSSLGDIGQELNEEYGFDNATLRLLEECGLLNGLRMENQLNLIPGECGGFENKGNILLFESKVNNKITLTYTCYSLTRVGIELFPVVFQKTQNRYLWDLGNAIEKHYPDLTVSIHPLKSINSDEITYDPNINLLKQC